MAFLGALYAMPEGIAKAAAGKTERRAMFQTIDEARQALQELFDPRQVDIMIEALQPCLGFEPAEARPEPGQTRIGGQPDLGPGIDWPVRPVPANLDEIAKRGGFNHGDRILRDLSQPRAYEFLLQVDLSEAAAISPLARELLPSEGHLLFFYDSSSGPWRSDADACRVIWDQSAIGDLRETPLPQSLIDQQNAFVAEWNDYAASSSTLSPYPDGKSQFWGPKRPMRLADRLALPNFSSLEAQSNPALVDLLKHDDTRDDYDSFFADAWEGTGSPRQQLLGAPLPEQDDPRYDAVVEIEYPQGPPRGEAWKAAFPRIEAAAADWLLLMQVSQSDYLQDRSVEGTVYFVIRKDDLKARAFDKVLPIYQQT